MASIISRSNGTREIRFCIGEDRRTIRLGKCPKKRAVEIKHHVEELASAKASRTSIGMDTAKWLAGVEDEIHRRLAGAKLVEPRRRADAPESLTLSELLDGWIARDTGIKSGTILNRDQSRKHLLRLVGDLPIESITPAHGDDFRRAMRADYSEAYTGKMVSLARQMFNDAKRRRLIPENPFADVKRGSQKNPERQRFIDASTIERVIEAAPDVEWKLLIALSRYGGLRVPSEPLALTWQDVDWERKRIVIHSVKTEHHVGKATRIIPMFPEIESRLRDVFDAAPDGSTHVITRYRSTTQNLRTQFERIITRAGVTPWPKLWHNLRASRQTELARDYPIHVVCQWIGNSKDVAMDHYLQTTDADYERATAKPIDKAHQNAHQSASELSGWESKPIFDGLNKPPVFPSGATERKSLHINHIAGAGLELSQNIPDFSMIHDPCAPKCAPLSADLRFIIDVWPSLPDSVKRSIIQSIRLAGASPVER